MKEVEGSGTLTTGTGIDTIGFPVASTTAPGVPHSRLGFRGVKNGLAARGGGGVQDAADVGRATGAVAGDECARAPGGGGLAGTVSTGGGASIGRHTADIRAPARAVPGDESPRAAKGGALASPRARGGGAGLGGDEGDEREEEGSDRELHGDSG